MNRRRVTDEQWRFMEEVLHAHPWVYIVDLSTCRQFVEALLWMLRSGSQ